VIRVGICGYGYWGANLTRAFAQSPVFHLSAIADLESASRAKAHATFPSAHIFQSAEDLIDTGGVDAVAIATPVSTHFPLSASALRRRLHVLTEKPMASSSAEAEELVELAHVHRARLLVDHIYLFHDAVMKLKELKNSDVLGKVSYYDSLRVNLGLFQPDMSVLWDLAPHDFSITDFLFDEDPIHIEATGYCHVNQQLPDIVYVTAHYASRMIAHVNLSWMSPVKVRRIAVAGNKKMAVWDDLNNEERLKIYDSGVVFHGNEQRSTIIPSYRIGDVYSPRLINHEPLARLVDHFGRVIIENLPSPVDGQAGLRIVKLLDQAQRSLDMSLAALERKGVGQMAQ
jgi:predicted dehydrogenase